MVEVSSATLKRMRKNIERVEKENKRLRMRVSDLESETQYNF